MISLIVLVSGSVFYILIEGGEWGQENTGTGETGNPCPFYSNYCFPFGLFSLRMSAGLTSESIG
jgi:hypothetical protein